MITYQKNIDIYRFMSILIFDYLHIQTSLYFLTLVFNIYVIVIFYFFPSLILLGGPGILPGPQGQKHSGPPGH